MKDEKVPERWGRRSVARRLLGSSIVKLDESGEQPVGKGAFGDRPGGRLDLPAISKQEGSEDSIRVHGFQRIGHDGVEILSDEFRPCSVEEAFLGLQSEADPGSCRVVDFREIGQKIRHGFEVEGMNTVRPADLLGGVRPRKGAEVRHGRGHDQQIMGRPAILKFPVEVGRGLEPNLGNSRMWARIDGPRASKKRDRMSKIPGGPRQFGSQTAR